MITFEKKFTPDPLAEIVGSDGKAQTLHRWRCCTCGSFGVWLLKLEAVERNASLHARVCMQHPNKEVR